MLNQGGVDHRGAPRPGLHHLIGRVIDYSGFARRGKVQQFVLAAVIVAIDGVKVAQRASGKTAAIVVPGRWVRAAQPATSATAPTNIAVIAATAATTPSPSMW